MFVNSTLVCVSAGNSTVDTDIRAASTIAMVDDLLATAPKRETSACMVLVGGVCRAEQEQQSMATAKHSKPVVDLDEVGMLTGLAAYG